jgi:DNA-binding transcriptional ArsR family regulator
MATNGLLPARDAVDVENDPEVVNFDQAGDVLDVLSSTTARRVLLALYDSPLPMSDLAEEVDTSLQNVEYHLGRLEAAGVVEVTDTWYSSKGAEMDVYAPTSAPLVVFVGDPDTEEAMADAIDDHAARAVPDA